MLLPAICQSKRTRVRKWKRKIRKTGQEQHGSNIGNTEVKYIYESLAKKKNGKRLLSKMSIIRRGFFPYTVAGERRRRGEVIGEEKLIHFFLSRKSISCRIFSTLHSSLSKSKHKQFGIFLPKAWVNPFGKMRFFRA